jgi:uncharacterized SAM-binding protein YcdF (DUF218 family)
LNHEPLKADVIVTLGTNDIRVAHHAADLFHGGFAPLMVCTGGFAHQKDLLATGWNEPEAVVFSKVLEDRGVPTERILLETAATNTAENISLSRALLQEKAINPRNILFAVKPFMQRRTMATFAVRWPEVPASISSWRSTFDDYCTPELPPEKITNIMMGDLQRIWIYARKGWSAPQILPVEVREAYEGLRAMGFTKHLLPEP